MKTSVSTKPCRKQFSLNCPIAKKLLMTAIVGGCSSVALAQQGFSVLEEVTVTARKRVESLQDVPIAVTTVGKVSIGKARRSEPEGYETYCTQSTLFR